jgi:hypothetical protein
MTDQEIYKLLKILDGELVAVQGPVNLSEPCHVTEFHALRNGDTVKIKILDSGPEFHAPGYRYNCEAWIEDETGRRASRVVTGNGASTPEEALEIAHWHDLDLRNDES